MSKILLYVCFGGFLLYFLNSGSTATETNPSDLYFCGDWDCKDFISRGKTLLNYAGRTDKHLSFKQNEDILILSKPENVDGQDWVGMVRRKVGLVPKTMVREDQMGKHVSKFRYPLNVLPIWSQNEEDESIPQVESVSVQEESDQVESVSVQEESDQVESVSVQEESDQVESVSVQEESDQVESISVQEESDQVESVSVQEESDQVESVSVQNETFPVQVESVSVQKESDQVESVSVQEESDQVESVSVHKESVPDQVESVSVQKESVSVQEEFVSEKKSVHVQVESVPVQVESVPVQVESVPVQVESLPVQVKSVPVQVESVPDQVESVPVQVESVSVQEEPVPVQEEPVTVQVESVSVQKETAPDQEESAPDQEESAPDQEESAPDQEEPVPVQEEPVSFQKEFISEKKSVHVQVESAPNQEESAPYQVKSVPVQVESVPVQVKSVPVQVESVPVQEESASVQVESVSVQEESVPVQVESAPNQEESAPDQVESVSVQEESVPVQVKSVPVQVKSVSVQVESVSVQKETFPVQEESASVQVESVPVQLESVSVQNETFPVQVESVPVEVESVSVQNETFPVQVESVPVEVESVSVQEESVPVQVESVPVQEESAPTIEEFTQTLEESHQSHHHHHHSQENQSNEESSSFIIIVKHLGSTILSFLPEHLQDTIIDVEDALVFTGIIALALVSICVPYFIIEGFFAVKPLKKKVVELNKSLWKVTTAYENQQDEFEMYKKKALAYDEDKSRIEQLEYELGLLKTLEGKHKNEVKKLNIELKSNRQLAEDTESLYNGLKLKLREAAEEGDKWKKTASTMKEALKRLSNENQDAQSEAASVFVDLELAKQSNETLTLRVEVLERELGEMKGKHGVEIERRRKVEEELDEVSKSKLNVKTELSDLKRICHQYEETVSDLSTQISQQENELAALKETLGEDSPLIDIAEVKGKLVNAEQEVASLQSRVESTSLENISLSRSLKDSTSSLSTIQLERDEAMNRLQVLEAWFKEKEEELRKAVERYEAEKNIRGKDKDELVRMIEEKRDENKELFERLESCKVEFEELKTQQKNEIRTLETKSHENWLSLCQAERKAQDARKEAEFLRQKLTALMKDNERDVEELNGESPMYPFLAQELIPPPLDEIPSYFGLGEGFMPPPPLPLLEGERGPHRLAPLGRLSPTYYSDLEDAMVSPIRHGGRREEDYLDGDSSESDSPRHRRSIRGEWVDVQHESERERDRDRDDRDRRHRGQGGPITSSPIPDAGINL